jgi:hypothetical protein
VSSALTYSKFSCHHLFTTNLELSVTQLAVHGRTIYIPNSITWREQGSHIFSDNYLSTPFHLRALLLCLLPDADSLCESGPTTHTTLLIYHGGLYHRLGHSRPIVDADGCVGHVGWEFSHTASDFLTGSVPSSTSYSNENNASIPLVIGAIAGLALRLIASTGGAIIDGARGIRLTMAAQSDDTAEFANFVSVMLHLSLLSKLA